MTKGYEQRKESNKRYLEKQDELKIRVPGGRKSDIETHAKNIGMSVNGLVNYLLRVDMGIETEEEWKSKQP